ncbi:hypothetical protein [Nocardioides fonticola]|uniref:hypothetical protein n=1 Tax=Nocardioides fonticola TaxID=450363 RepID=UPI0031D33178
MEADLPSASVTITGGSAPVVGAPLTASVALASSVDGLVVAWRWSRVVDGVATSIEGATGSSYTPSADDVGAVLQATASLSASGFRSGSASADTSPVAAAGLPALRLAVKGKTRVGRVVNGALTGLPSVDEVPGLSVAWSWQRISRKGTVRSVPSAAGLPAFRKLTRADRGKRLRVTAVVTAPGYDTVTVSRTTKVVRKGRIAKPDVRIVRDGVVLVATVAGLSGLSTAVPGLAVSYRWRDASGRGLGDGKRLVVPSGYVGRIVLLVRLAAPGYEPRRVARSYRYGGGR